MDPRPVISIHGNVNLFRNSIQSHLQGKLRAKRPQNWDCRGLSSYCPDVDFQLFDNFAKEQPTRLPFYSEPCLHTYWTDCSEVDQYRNRVWTEALPWVHYVEEHRSCKEVEWIVVHVTAMRDSKGKAPSSVLEKMRSDFDSKGGGGLPRVVSLKLPPNLHSKAATEAWSAVSERIYTASVDGLSSLLNRHKALTAARQGKVENFQAAFLNNVDLAVGLELLNEPGKALALYHELATRLSSSLSEIAQRREDPPPWCTSLMAAPCTSWYCPSLSSSSESWKYLTALHSWKASLLEIKLFLYARMLFTLFALRRVWQAETICSEVLHTTAREMRRFKPNIPPSAFNCWAYAIARMTVLEIMLHLTADVVGNAYMSNSPLLIRVRLWSYAFEKLDAVGRDCGLMPNSRDKPANEELLTKLLKGLEGQPHTVDEETQLMKALKSKEGFSEVYVDMGMRVIGALKHAGRRRAAFSFAKDVALFLRDEGKLEEVVELLIDICKYYSGQGWVEISEGVYTTLAASLKELGHLEDYVRMVAVLINLYSCDPDLPDIDKKVAPWMEELERLSQLPREELDLQSRLKWQPLFQLVELQRPSAAGDHCVVNSSVECTVVLNYQGPKDLTVSTISVISQRDQDSPLNALQKVPKQHLRSHQHSPPEEEEVDGGQLSLFKQFGSLESVDLLDDEPSSQPLTDALSGSDEFLANLALETCLPQTTPALQPTSSINSLDLLGEGDAHTELFLSAGPVLLKPGKNTVRLTGLARSPGKFDLYKAVVSIGNLSFTTGVQKDGHAKISVIVLDTENNISVTISPTSDIVLAGLPQRCLLKLTVGPDTYIPKDALLRISSPTGIKFITPPKLRPTGKLSPVITRQQPDQPHPNYSVFLPAVGAGRSFTTAIHILAPSLVTNGTDQEGKEGVSHAWTHQIAVQCDWLVPVHTASVPVTVFEPLSYCTKEVPAEDRVLVQLVMENSCPLPLLLRSPKLATTLNMIQLSEALPQALLPGQDFSFLWQVHREASEKVKQDQSCTFSVQWRAVYQSQELRETSEFHKSEHQFTLCSTATEFRVISTVQTNRESGLRTNCNALLQFVVQRCFSTDAAQSLSYKVELDERFWRLVSQESGELFFPALISEANITFEICPLQYGELPMPCLALRKIEKSSHSPHSKLFKPVIAYSASKAEFVHVVPVQSHS